MSATEAAPAKARVLFVDDEPRVLTSMKMLFRGAYDMHFADGAQKAIDLLKVQPVEVIVSDQRMPGMTGVELLRAARDINPHAMRILLTGYSDLNAIVGSVNEGEIFRFVNKPWANDVLASTVASAVSAARASLAISKEPEPVAAPLAPGAAALLAPAVLVLDDDAAVAARIQTILGKEFRVRAANSMEAALECLEKDEISVVISESRVQNTPVVSLIGLLKQHQPQLVTVILTDRADAGAAIELINQGQIYRLMTKPVQDITCRIMVGSAHKHHQQLMKNPVLHQRYEVEKIAAPVIGAAPAPATKFLDRVRSLRSWFSGKAASA